MTRKQNGRRAVAGGIAAALLFVAGDAAAAIKRSVCVFDIVGQHGDIFNMMRDYKLAALQWGVEVELKPYTDEKIAAEDLKAGQCDAALITGIRGRLFNTYTGSLDSIGALPDYESVRLAHQAMASPKLAEKMKSGPYEVIGIAPMGAAFLFVNDRRINNVGALSGKRITVLDYDKAQAKMVQKVGASPIASDVTNFAGKFNNKSADICAAPAAAYKALELYKGISPNGGVVRYPLAQITLQMISRSERFAAAPGYTQKSREWFFGQFDRTLAVITKAEKEIEAKYWIDVPAADKPKYDEMMRQSRISLRDEGIYNRETLELLRKVRCRRDGSRAECTEKVE
ncbi:MAG: putative solute-binding protein [Gammaproteobacteria bacterium]